MVGKNAAVGVVALTVGENEIGRLLTRDDVVVAHDAGRDGFLRSHEAKLHIVGESGGGGVHGESSARLRNGVRGIAAYQGEELVIAFNFLRIEFLIFIGSLIHPLNEFLAASEPHVHRQS